jgi:hypothetical protein
MKVRKWAGLEPAPRKRSHRWELRSEESEKVRLPFIHP